MINLLQRRLRGRVASYAGVINTFDSTHCFYSQSREKVIVTDDNRFLKLGLLPQIAEALAAQEIVEPTSVQKLLIPMLLTASNKHIIASSCTGSGKTFAYTLPAIQSMILQEQSEQLERKAINNSNSTDSNDSVSLMKSVRQPKKPRCLILVPTRDLARQVLSSVKDVSHFAKVSSTVIMGGESHAAQKKNLNGLIDIVVASPSRLLQHKEQGNVSFSNIRHVIIDEVDTMLTQGFGEDIKNVLHLVMESTKKNSPMVNSFANSIVSVESNQSTSLLDLKKQIAAIQKKAVADKGRQAKEIPPSTDAITSPVRVVMTSATLTKPLKSLLNTFAASPVSDSASNVTLKDIETSGLGKLSMSKFDMEFEDPYDKTPKARKLALEKPEEIKKNVRRHTTYPVLDFEILEVAGVNSALPNVRHVAIETKGEDKLTVLDGLLQRRQTNKAARTLIFCNTVSSCRAVQFHLSEHYDVTGDESEVLVSDASPDFKNSRGHSPCQSECYHGDMRSSERTESLGAYRSGAISYLVCTDIAARGLDIPETTHVILFDFPLNAVDYIHRAGRTGRAGRSGLVTSIVTKRDKVLSDAILGAIARNLPIDNLTSARRDYEYGGVLAPVMGRVKATGRKVVHTGPQVFYGRHTRYDATAPRGASSVKKIIRPKASFGFGRSGVTLDMDRPFNRNRHRRNSSSNLAPRSHKNSNTKGNSSRSPSRSRSSDKRTKVSGKDGDKRKVRNPVGTKRKQYAAKARSYA